MAIISKSYLLLSLILQTLQQLRDVYGDSVDKIVQGNTSNIVFLKSTDDSMLDTLQKMSGTRHTTYTDSKTITKDMQAMVKMVENEGKTSYTMTTKEEPVISYNDMAFISERNSIVFRAGDSPIWNRNETILPMSWRLFKNTIIQPGKEYSLQTIPTLSTAMDFDVRKNQPNFSKMLEKRMEQAYVAMDAAKTYQDAYGYSDYDIEQLDPDNYSDDVMDIIYSTLSPQEVKDAIENENSDNPDAEKPDEEEYEEMFDYIFGNQDNKGNSKFTVEQDIYNEFDGIEENKAQKDATAMVMAQQQEASVKRYAGKSISRDMLVSPTGINHGLDSAIIRVYKDIRGKMEKDTEYFTSMNGNLCDVNTGRVYIKNVAESKKDIDAINEAAKDENSRVYAEEDIDMSDADAIGSFVVTDSFLKFLVSFNNAWPFADGEFESRMKKEMMGGETDAETEARIKREQSGQR
ncbi:TraM recognition domain-containing protein [bacterium]|nr:TraM recognition domain-containing protein [bacterium]